MTPAARAAPVPDLLPITGPAAAAIFAMVLTRGPLARVEVARRLGLSSAAVTKAVRPLLDAGYLAELPDDRGDPTVGRPAYPLHVVPDRRYFVGVKVTSTELFGVLVDLRAQIRAVHHTPLSSTGAGEVVAAIGAVVSALLAEDAGVRERVAGVGVSVSGGVDHHAGTVRDSPRLGWHDVPLADLVGAGTGLPTVVDNDVRALTVTEHWFGTGAGAGSFALVTIGAGIGCGLYLNGEVLAGAHGVSGEIGHLPLVPYGPVCSCGRQGCVEAVASSEAILRQVRALTGDPGRTLADAVDLAHRGDTTMRNVFDRAGHVIGLALATVANLVGPERIVISGEGVADYDLYDHRVREAFEGHAFGAAADCELIVRPLSFDEWARGAAAVAIRAFASRTLR